MNLDREFPLGRSIMIFPKFSVFGYYEYRLDLGLVNDLPVAKEYTSDTVWSAGAEYMLSRNVSLMGSYDNRFVQEVGCLSDFKIHWHKFIYELDIQYRNNFKLW
jgi:hypothetical protein